MADFQYRSSEFYGTRGAIYFPMQQDMNFPKLFLHTITIIDYQ